MWTEPKRISRCVRCDSFFWVDDTEIVGELENSPRGVEELDVISTDAVPEDHKFRRLGPGELLEALDEGFGATSGETRYLRRRVWWRANHPIREAVQEDKDLGEYGPTNAVRDNLTAMLDLLDPEDEEDRLARGEVLRELGQFSEAMRVLDVPFEDEERQEYAGIISELASKQRTEVRPLDHNEKNA